MRTQTTSNVYRFINSKAIGELFTTRELLKFGQRASIDQLTFRLVNNGEIYRVARGVFVKINNESDIPPLAEIIKKKAEAFGRNLYVHATNALKRIGLATAKQKEKLVFATDGNTSSFLVLMPHGAVRIQFKHYAARKLVLKDSTFGMMIRALWHRRRDALKVPVIEHVYDMLGRSGRAELFTHAHWMPWWMSDKLVHKVGVILTGPKPRADSA